MKREAFSCTRDGLTIRGTAFLPEGTRLPIAVVSHGFLADQTSMEEYAMHLAGFGCAAFAFDFNGGGQNSTSDGKSTDMSVLTEREDLKTVIAYARGLEITDSNRVLLMGASQGGFVSALTAAALQELISALILLCPAFCIPDDARRGRLMHTEYDPKRIPGVMDCGPMQIGRCYPEAVMGMDAYEEITAYQGPVLILHGTGDRLVNISYARMAEKRYQETRGEQSAPCRLVELEGADHCFTPEEGERIRKEAEAFLKTIRFI